MCNKKVAKSTTLTTSTTTEAVTTTKTVQKVLPVRTTTTTQEPEEEDEEEYEDEIEAKHEEEDPKVIKELLDLIKKAGGIEELEKQLNIQDDDTTTPSTIKKSLVQRVLAKAAQGARKNTYASINRNSRGPQNEGLLDKSKVKETENRPKYTTITRQRGSNKPEEIEDEKTTKKQPEYVNIRRGRLSTTTEDPEEK